MHRLPILTLAAAITSAGGAEITVRSGGKLIVKSELTSAGTGVLVESGGEFQIGGIVNSSVTVDSGGVLDVGSTEVTSAELNGDLALAGTLKMQLGNVANAPICDHLTGLTSITMGGTLEIQHFGESSPTAGQSFDIWDSVIATGNAPAIAAANLTGGLFYHTSDLQTSGALNVGMAAETYETWAAAYGAETELSDMNQDGVVNKLEFALGISPQGGGNTLPVHELLYDGTGNILALAVNLPVPCPSTVEYTVEASDSLDSADWEVIAQRIGNAPWSGPASITEDAAANGIQTYHVKDTSSGTKRFMRLRVK
jgi:hypothetical protein